MDAGQLLSIVKLDPKTFKMSLQYTEGAMVTETKWTVETQNGAECDKWLSLVACDVFPG